MIGALAFEGYARTRRGAVVKMSEALAAHARRRGRPYDWADLYLPEAEVMEVKQGGYIDDERVA